MTATLILCSFSTSKNPGSILLYNECPFNTTCCSSNGPKKKEKKRKELFVVQSRKQKEPLKGILQIKNS